MARPPCTLGPPAMTPDPFALDEDGQAADWRAFQAALRASPAKLAAVEAEDAATRQALLGDDQALFQATLAAAAKARPRLPRQRRGRPPGRAWVALPRIVTLTPPAPEAERRAPAGRAAPRGAPGQGHERAHHRRPAGIRPRAQAGPCKPSWPPRARSARPRPRGPARRDTVQLYKQLHDSGLQYGPAFRLLRNVHTPDMAEAPTSAGTVA